jgi:hypothetical protein
VSFLFLGNFLPEGIDQHEGEIRSKINRVLIQQHVGLHGQGTGRLACFEEPRL